MRIFLDGSSPLKVPAKKSNTEIQFQKISDMGHASSIDLGNVGGEWGRGGSPWAHTLGKRSHGLQEGF